MSLHEDAVHVLESWQAPDHAQDALRRDYLAHLAAHPNGVWRGCVPGHLTASAAVLDPGGGHVLLTLHRKERRWLQLGEHCEDGDTTLTTVAFREATEESGIAGLELLPVPVRLDRHDVACQPGGSRHLDVQYAGVAPAGARPELSSESLDLRWFPVDALPDNTDESVRALVAHSAGLVASLHR